MNEYEMGHSLDVLDQENGWNAKDDLRVCFFLFFFFFISSAQLSNADVYVTCASVREREGRLYNESEVVIKAERAGKEEHDEAQATPIQNSCI